ncbi:MAG TPA: hypothetical protein VHZ31_08540 [Solirubrobacteraceae bacterium]|nr:hypothetical protein [Solirubrobacteraceae bacterium]
MSQLNGGNRVKKVKKFFEPVLANPQISIPVAFVLLVVLGGGIALIATSGGGGGSKSATGTTKQHLSKKDKSAIAKAKKRHVKAAPVVNGSGTVDIARSVGRLAIAQGRGRIKHPVGVKVRVSAAPKQTVTVTYQLSCFKAVGKYGTTQIGSGSFHTKPPSIRSLPLPMSGADECTATVGAQLTKDEGSGRIKVAVLAG